MNILEHLNQLPFNFFYLNVDDFLDLDLPQLENLYSISPKQLNIELTSKNSGRLLQHETTVSFIKNACQNGNKAVIIPFKPSAKLDIICQKHNWILAANKANLNRLFEDKLKFPQICQEYKIPIIDFFIAPFNSTNYSIAESKFGRNLVIQTHFGWAGKSTYHASSYNSAKQIIGQNTRVKFSPFLSGYSLLNNCCLAGKSLIQSLPAIQYTGIKPLTSNPFTTVGRQWPSNAPKRIIDQVMFITQDFSKILAKKSYRGFFGLDFLISNNQVYLLECNPRLTASFSFYTSLELRSGINPLFLIHLAQFLPVDTSIDIKKENQNQQNSNITGSELTRKNSSGTTIAKYSDTIEFSKSFDPPIIPQHIIDKLF